MRRKGKMETKFTFCYWYGGKFVEESAGVVYVGGMGRTFDVCPVDCCMKYLLNLAESCVNGKIIDGLYYCVPGVPLSVGLKKIVSEDQVFELSQSAILNRFVDVYVLARIPVSPLSVIGSPSLSKVESGTSSLGVKTVPKKLTIRRGPQSGMGGKKQPSSNLDMSFHVDTTLDSWLINEALSEPPTSNLVIDKPSTSSINKTTPPVDLGTKNKGKEPCRSEGGEDSSDDSDEEDESVDLGVEADVLLHENEFLNEEHGIEESSDEEYVQARETVKKVCSRLADNTKQVEEDVVKTCLAESGEEVQIGEDNERTQNTSEYEESGEEQESPLSSKGEDDEGKRKKTTLVPETTDFKTFEWAVGQRFGSKKHFKQALAKYAVYQGRNVGIRSSSKKFCQRTVVKCVPGCSFYLYGSWDSRRCTFVVKTVQGEHSCCRNMEKNRQLKAMWVARQLLDVFKTRPHWPGREIMDAIKRAFGVIVKKNFAYKVKYNAHRLLHGSMTEHYNKLGVYVHVLKQACPGSLIELMTDGDNGEVFKRLHICFEGLKQGWLDGCRKVICIDACFLKTFLGGQLLVAIGRDNNDQMFPISWAVVEGENNESWGWFLSGLQRYLELGAGDDVVIISDEHKSIISCVAQILPKAEHRHCARHVYANWHKSFKGDELKMLFWKAAKAWNVADFEQALEEMAVIDDKAVEVFKSYNPACFCRAFMKSSCRVDVIVNNMAETFNGYIINARTKHVMSMLEDIRTAVMQRLFTKKIESEKWKSNYGPRVIAKLEKEKEKARCCDAIPSTSTIFQCTDPMGDVLSVDLELKTCSCRRWDLTGIPCRHAVACISFLHQQVEDYIDPLYTKDRYLKAYSFSIPPIEGPKFWPKISSSLIPPPIKIGPGRPRKKRRRDPHESPKKPGKLSKHGTEMTCGICSQKGHNRRGCPNKSTSAAAQPINLNEIPEHTQTTECQGSTPSLSLPSAQPTRTGRHGRSIRSGVGARGGARGGSARRGRSASKSTQGSQPSQSSQPTQGSKT